MRKFEMIYGGVDYIVTQGNDDAPALVITKAGMYVAMIWPFPGAGASQEMMEASVREHLKQKELTQ